MGFWINTVNILFAFPYLGELGWEIGNWLPYVFWHAQRQAYDVIYVGTRAGREALYSGLMQYTSSVRASVSIGFEDATECNVFLRERPEAWHHWRRVCAAAAEEANTLAHAGNSVRRLSLPSMSTRMFNTPRAERTAPVFADFSITRTDIAPGTVVMHVRALTRSPRKNTKPEQIAAVREFCRKAGLPLVLVGTDQTQLVDNGYGTNLMNRTNMADLIGIFQRAALVVGSSSGPMHLAAAVGVPHIVWGGERTDVATRYADTWNLRRTPCRVLTLKWKVHVPSLKLAMAETLNVKTKT